MSIRMIHWRDHCEKREALDKGTIYKHQQEFLLTGKAFCKWFNHKYWYSFYWRRCHWRFPRVSASTLPMTRVSYLVLKERKWAYLRLALMKRKILALRFMYLMQPQADIDEIELETKIPMLLYLLFQWLVLFQQMSSGSPMDLERMYRISQQCPWVLIKRRPYRCSMHQMGVILFRLLEGVEKKRLGMCGTCFHNWHQC